jgi:glutamate-5-semialdehyde dehydrogenase
MLTKADSAVTDIPALMAEMGRRARAASGPLAVATTDRKNAALAAMADAIMAGEDDILAANAIDMEKADECDLSPAFKDRLHLTKDRVAAMADGIRAIADLKDPVGAVIAEWDRPNGLQIERVRTPLGRHRRDLRKPSQRDRGRRRLCLKAGNAVILRGGSESFHSSPRSTPVWSRASPPPDCRKTRSSASRRATAPPSANC